jgi:dTDP-4-amino-4,6-dideoxygalactose transaminase
MPGPGLDLYGEEEKSALLKVLAERSMSRYRFNSDDNVEPSQVYQFERAFERYTCSKHCIGMSSCTSALLVGAWATGIGGGMEVIVPGYTFVAPIAAMAYAGATPVLAEIDESLTLDPDDVERKINARTRALLVVHMLGAPGKLDVLHALAKKHGLLLFEDCAQAGGGSYQGRSLGTWGAFGAFSLNVFKTFTSGDGGILLTGDTQLYEDAFAIHDHGARPFRKGVADADSFLGLNFRMHEVTGALARVQLEKLPEILRALRGMRDAFVDSVGDLPLANLRPLNDKDGDCATVVVYQFDTPAVASAVARELGTITLADSGKHNYANIRQLKGRKLPRAYGALKEDRNQLFEQRYELGTLPKTDSLLARSIAISVGVNDSYLGSGFGLNIHASKDDITSRASELRNAVTRALWRC